jgi:hypothetical protein
LQNQKESRLPRNQPDAGGVTYRQKAATLRLWAAICSISGRLRLSSDRTSILRTHAHSSALCEQLAAKSSIVKTSHLFVDRVGLPGMVERLRKPLGPGLFPAREPCRKRRGKPEQEFAQRQDGLQDAKRHAADLSLSTIEIAAAIAAPAVPMADHSSALTPSAKASAERPAQLEGSFRRSRNQVNMMSSYFRLKNTNGRDEARPFARGAPQDYSA